MLGLPSPGERVTFRAAEGHRVPWIGRPGQFYEPGVSVTEAWTVQHHARCVAGALVVIDCASKTATQSGGA